MSHNQSQASNANRPQNKTFPIVFCSIALAAGIWGAISIRNDRIKEQQNDNLEHAGGRDAVYRWVKQDGLISKLDQLKGSTTSTNHQTPRFVVWLFGDGYYGYKGANTGSTSIGKADFGNVSEWGAANSVLLIKLTSEFVTYKFHKKEGVFGYSLSSTEKKVEFYHVTAWLVDRVTRQVVASNSFEFDTPKGRGSSNPFQTVITEDDFVEAKYTAVPHAKKWARNLTPGLGN